MVELGQGATLRGVEAVAEGWLFRDGSELLLAISHTGESVRLGPLKQKVQWDREAAREETATAAERSAYARLAGRRLRRFFPVRIVGPLERVADGERLILRVRQYTLNP